MAAQQPAAQTGRLRGEAPDIFHGDRSKSETFKQQFKVYQGINDNHEVMQNPYYRTMQALSLIKGPLVNDWVDDQIIDLMEKVSRQQNPITTHRIPSPQGDIHIVPSPQKSRLQQMLYCGHRRVPICSRSHHQSGLS
jgi:hypothetical protein